MNILTKQSQYDELYVSRSLASAIAKISESFDNKVLLSLAFCRWTSGKNFYIKNHHLDKSYIELSTENFFNALKDRNIYLAKMDNGNNVLAHSSLENNDSFVSFDLTLSHILLSIADKNLRQLLLTLFSDNN